MHSNTPGPLSQQRSPHSTASSWRRNTCPWLSVNTIKLRRSATYVHPSMNPKAGSMKRVANSNTLPRIGRYVAISATHILAGQMSSDGYIRYARTTLSGPALLSDVPIPTKSPAGAEVSSVRPYSQDSPTSNRAANCHELHMASRESTLRSAIFLRNLVVSENVSDCCFRFSLRSCCSDLGNVALDIWNAHSGSRDRGNGTESARKARHLNRHRALARRDHRSNHLSSERDCRISNEA